MNSSESVNFVDSVNKDDWEYISESVNRNEGVNWIEFVNMCDGWKVLDLENTSEFEK